MNDVATEMSQPSTGALRFLKRVAISVIGLPIIFIAFYSLGGAFSSHHISLRLGILVTFAVFCIVLGRRYLGYYPFAAPPVRLWVVIAVLVIIALSRLLVDGNDAQLTLERTTMWLMYLVVGLVLFELFQKVSHSETLILVTIAIVGTTILYVTMIGIWWSYDGLPSGLLCTDVMPGFKNVRYTAYFAAPALGLAIAISALHDGGRALRIVAAGAAVLIWLYVEYTGARGAALAIFAAGLLSFLIIPAKIAVRFVVFGLVTAIAGIMIALVLPAPDCPSFGMLSRIFTKMQTDNPTTGRIEMWMMTWDLIKARPWLGYGEIRLFKFVDTHATQPHNAVLQILLAWGFVGAVLFLAIVGEFLVRVGFAARRGSWQAWPLVFGLLVILIYGQISGALYHAFPLFFATILSAAGAALLFRPKTHPDA